DEADAACAGSVGAVAATAACPVRSRHVLRRGGPRNAAGGTLCLDRRRPRPTQGRGRLDVHNLTIAAPKLDRVVLCIWGMHYVSRSPSAAVRDMFCRSGAPDSAGHG